MGNIKVILQKMNKDVFAQPVELMENVMGVTAYLREQIIKNGGDPERETLNVIRTVKGDSTIPEPGLLYLRRRWIKMLRDGRLM